MAINLLAQKARWQGQWNSMQTLMSTLSSKYTPSRMTKFILYWNAQVYKALEASWRVGLESLNESMGEVRKKKGEVPTAIRIANK